MHGKFVIGVSLLAVALVAGYFLLHRAGSRPSVTAALRIKVAPADRLGAVTEKASSPLFKYLIGKRAGVKPALAQKLEVKAVPESSLLEAKVVVMSREEERQYAEAFVPVLQELCGSEARLSLVDPLTR